MFYTVIITELETIGRFIPCMISAAKESDYIEQISHLYARICDASGIIIGFGPNQ
jgi:hypothetical protein